MVLMVLEIWNFRQGSQSQFVLKESWLQISIQKGYVAKKAKKTKKANEAKEAKKAISNGKYFSYDRKNLFGSLAVIYKSYSHEILIMDDFHFMK